MRDFREIKVWAKAHLLTLEIYKVTATFPRDEIYGLTSQLRRSSASIGANIAEGFGKRGQQRARAIPPDRDGICERGRVSYPLSQGSESPNKKDLR